jgi:hypothetical protein
LGNSIFSSFTGAGGVIGAEDFFTGVSALGDGTEEGFEIGGGGGAVTTIFSCCCGAGADVLCSCGIFELLVGSYLKGFSSSTKKQRIISE